MPATLVVSNRKGGAGKTTVSVNLAAELAASGRRVLLVDLDSQSHCAMGLGIKVGKTTPTSHDLFRNQDARLAAAILPTAYPNLALIPADPLFEHGSGRRDEGLLAQALSEEDMTAAFDVVILDTPPSLDILLLNALMAADWVLIPYVPHPLSFEGVRQLTRVLFKIISGPNPGLKLAGFLPMMAAEHIRQHRAVNSDVARQFGDLRMLPGIRNDIRLAESFGAGKPVHYYAPQSRAANDFAVLAAAISEKVWER
jgi:chromosome partitioning protein